MADYLFALWPQNDQAREVVNYKTNRNFCRSLVDGDTEKIALCFDADQPGKIPGQLVSFGRNATNDIVFPDVKEQRYKSFHFYFFLVPETGELMLRDMTGGRTEIMLLNATTADEDLYALHGNLRLRAIPRDPGWLFFIKFGVNAIFKFTWGQVMDHDTQQEDLARKAAALAVSGMGPTMSTRGNATALIVPRTDHQPRYTLRSKYVPTVQNHSQQRWPVHRYKTLGQGSFGIVYKVVDLSNGHLWALKELKPDQTSYVDRAALIREVEALYGLEKHDHIAGLKHFQDFNLEGRCQLFFELYDGNLAQIMPKHECLKLPHIVPPWFQRLTEQVASALVFLHSQNMIHRDIKPANILRKDKDDDPLPHFYLADFGLAKCVRPDQIESTAAGTMAYIAPEHLERRSTQKSDVWAFAVTLGEAFGFWCGKEMCSSEQEWCEKLKEFGIQHSDRGPGVRDLEAPNSETTQARLADCKRRALLSRWHARMREICPALPQAFAQMMEPEEPYRPTSTNCHSMTQMYPWTFFEVPKPQSPGNPTVLQAESPPLELHNEWWSNSRCDDTNMSNR